MKKILPVFVVAALALSACANTNSRRSPASSEPDSQSVELASKLRGGSLKFRAFREGDEVSVMGFLDLKFDNCHAVVNTESDSARGVEINGSYVNCKIKLNSDPVNSDMDAIIQGDKRNFNVRIVANKPEKYELDVNIDMSWENKRWKAKGKVFGWVSQKLGPGTSLTATVRETLSF